MKVLIRPDTMFKERMLRTENSNLRMVQSTDDKCMKVWNILERYFEVLGMSVQGEYGIMVLNMTDGTTIDLVCTRKGVMLQSMYDEECLKVISQRSNEKSICFPERRTFTFTESVEFECKNGAQKLVLSTYRQSKRVVLEGAQFKIIDSHGERVHQIRSVTFSE